MITYIIIAITCIFSIVGFSDRVFFSKFLFNPFRLHGNRKEWYTIFTHAFLHADYMHLFFNMFVFYNFGLLLEEDIYPDFFHSHSNWFFILLYVGGILVSSIPAYEKHKLNPSYSAVGASGAVYAVLFSYIMINPTSTLSLMFLPIPIPAFLLGIAYLFFESYMAKRGRTNIGHDAHLWGGIFGIVFTIVLRYQFVPEFYYKILSLFQ